MVNSRIQTYPVLILIIPFIGITKSLILFIPLTIIFCVSCTFTALIFEIYNVVHFYWTLITVKQLGPKIKVILLYE